ncbi:GHKL domain-containing protein [Persicimonas caeni]|uniref:histidine kinase n=1 Tax=Persicimonas caeni TaxID=2292766 RepID=A0A4Y6Q126_PERCE|nr:protoglobin domain-containing protein [Persicimonas caeni]QDG53685.1 GHKL domain-containing protein [Persicimonas caeni]QED34906.1 GHKL domain-containing protein [Persicimonas caeni]
MHFSKEIKDYMGFSGRDAECLNGLHPIVRPYFEEIVDHFYSSLKQNPRTKDVFTGPEQLERLGKSLHRWLDEVFTGPFDEEYFRKRQHVGRVHVDVGLQPQFMFGAMNIIRIDLTRAVFKEEERLEELQVNPRDCVESIERILDLELTIMTQAYWDKLMEMKLEIPSALAAGLAHEIRNPLNTMGLQLTLLDRRIRDVAKVDDTAEERISPIVDALRSELERIRTLTSEIMDFAKPIEVSPAWHDAGELLGELERVHGPTLETSQITFETELEGDAPIWCDIDRMRQVLVNLLTNAVEAIDDEGTIRVCVDNAEYGTTLTVEDSGEGMAPALKYRIFDLFFTTKAAGTGIGLPIIKKIVEAHGGSIDVSSQPGKGSKFSVFLPRPELRD